MIQTQQTGRQEISAALACSLSGHSCPECGSQLRRMGLCFACVSCGWGECG